MIKNLSGTLKNDKKSSELRKTRRNKLIEEHRMIRNISKFVIADKNIETFFRIVSNNKNNDCVINAMQIIGILDSFSANVCRITSLTEENGMMNSEQIAKIFSLKYDKLYKFTRVATKYEIFCNLIITNLNHSSNIVFCGYKGSDNIGHIFLIGYRNDKRFQLIDPQIKTSEPVICHAENFAPCFENYIGNKENYYLLKNEEVRLTKKQKEDMGFIYLDVGSNVIN